MTQPKLNNPEFKQLLKEALTETLQEKRELLHDVFVDVVEDIGLTEAIKKGMQTGSVDRSEVFDILEGRS